MKTDKALQMLGMAQRAGAVASGGFMTETSVKEGKEELMWLSNKTFVNEFSRVVRKCQVINHPWLN